MEKVPDFSADPKKIEIYQELFYLLQGEFLFVFLCCCFLVFKYSQICAAESRYVAKLVYLVNIDEVQHFLDTVLITLYGAAFSPREVPRCALLLFFVLFSQSPYFFLQEFLLLRLLQASIKNEMQVIKDIRGFIQAETVVPKMVITYNRRKQGVDYLKEVLGPLVKKVIEKGALNLDLNPKLIYQKLITGACVGVFVFVVFFLIGPLQRRRSALESPLIFLAT